MRVCLHLHVSFYDLGDLFIIMFASYFVIFVHLLFIILFLFPCDLRPLCHYNLISFSSFSLIFLVTGVVAASFALRFYCFFFIFTAKEAGLGQKQQKKELPTRNSLRKEEMIPNPQVLAGEASWNSQFEIIWQRKHSRRNTAYEFISERDKNVKIVVNSFMCKLDSTGMSLREHHMQWPLRKSRSKNSKQEEELR